MKPSESTCLQRCMALAFFGRKGVHAHLKNWKTLSSWLRTRRHPDLVRHRCIWDCRLSSDSASHDRAIGARSRWSYWHADHLCSNRCDQESNRTCTRDIPDEKVVLAVWEMSQERERELKKLTDVGSKGNSCLSFVNVDADPSGLYICGWTEKNVFHGFCILLSDSISISQVSLR